MEIDDKLEGMVNKVISEFTIQEKEKVIELLNNELGIHIQNSDLKY